MNMPIKSYCVVFCLLFVALLGATPVSAEVSCKDWGKWVFFRKAGHEDVSRCIEVGADPNAKNNDGETPLHYAAAGDNNNPAVITALVKAGADVSAKDKSGETPLHNAAQNKNPEVITALLNAGADVNAKDNFSQMPLHVAAKYNENPAVITALLKAGAEVNTKNNSGYTPLHEAAGSNENPAVITILVAAGADLKARDPFWKKTPLEIARKKNKPGHVAAFSAKAVAAFREKERKARASERKREMERRLLAKRVSCDKWNTATFFKHAAEKDVTRCLESGAKPNARNRYDETPLHMAAKFNKTPAVVAVLKNAGADLKARDKKGRTPLHTAAVFSKTPAIVTALIQTGADLNATDKRRRTPLEFAEKFSRTPAIVAVLKKATPPAKQRPPPSGRRATGKRGLRGYRARSGTRRPFTGVQVKWTSPAASRRKKPVRGTNTGAHRFTMRRRAKRPCS